MWGDAGRQQEGTGDGGGPRLNAEVFEIKGADGQSEDITLFKYRNGLGTLSQVGACMHVNSCACMPVRMRIHTRTHRHRHHQPGAHTEPASGGARTCT